MISKILYEKRSSPTEIRTLAKGFKVLCANPYTIGLLATRLAMYSPYQPNNHISKQFKFRSLTYTKYQQHVNFNLI